VNGASLSFVRNTFSRDVTIASVLASVNVRSARFDVGSGAGVIAACDKVLPRVKQLSLVYSNQITITHKFKHTN